MTKSSQKRRVKRGIKTASKKTAQAIAKNNGLDISMEVSADPLVQGAKISALEKALERVVHMSQVNQAELIRAFQLTDAHLWVLRQLCKDIVTDTVMLVDSETPAVNMDAYYSLFNAKQRQEAEAEAAAKALKDAGVTPLESDSPEVFGGTPAGHTAVPTEETNGAHP